MCFSAAASFTAAAGLSAGGSASLKKAKKDQKLLAMIPLLFAIHQASEGMVWLTLDKHPEFNTLFAAIYLFVAFCLWPVIFPLAALKIEKNDFKENLIKIILVIGIILSTFTAIKLFSEGFQPALEEGHLHYNFSPYKSAPNLLTVIYAACLALPFFLNKSKLLKIFATLIVASLLYTFLLYPTKVLPSVWCFFGALISIIIYIYLTNKSWQ